MIKPQVANAIPAVETFLRHCDRQCYKAKTVILNQGEESDSLSVLESLKRRDKRDTMRATAPLKVPDGAIVLDTTGTTIESVVKTIVDEVMKD